MFIHPQKAFESDDPQELLGFAVEIARTQPCALAILVDIRGGAARPVGSHVVIAADGRYAGYVSGGCVEAAITTEAILAMHDCKDRLVVICKDSPFKDIVLPCGGSITVAIHVVNGVTGLQTVMKRLGERVPAALSYHPDQAIITTSDPARQIGWSDGAFVNVYHPSTRAFVSGGSFEGTRLAALMKCRRPGSHACP